MSGVRRYFAVNLTDEAESDLRPRATLTPRSPEPRAPVEASVVMPVWPALALAALALLLLEWLAWCARSRDA